MSETNTETKNAIHPGTTPRQSRSLLVKQGNIISLNQLPLSPQMFGMCEEVELVEVKAIYAYDANNHPILDRIEAVKYTCVDGKNWYDIKIPNQSTPLITQEAIDQRAMDGNPVFIKIPLDKLVVKPYQNTGDRGILRISMQVPYIDLL